MARYSGTGKEVYQLIKDYSFEETLTGYTASVTYLESSTPPDDVSNLMILPVIGQSFNDEYPELIAVRVYFKGFLGNNTNCGKFWGVDYSTQQVNLQDEDAIPEQDLPRSMEISAENVAWEPQGDTYNAVWSTGQVIKQPQYLSISTFRIPVKRIITNYTDYSLLVADCINCTNMNPLFGFPEGAVCFKGAEMEEFRYRGSKRWMCTLQFEARRVNGNLEPDAILLGENSDGWGWNWQINESTGRWDVAVINDTVTRYYPENALELLFTTQPMGTKQNLINIPASKP